MADHYLNQRQPDLDRASQAGASMTTRRSALHYQGPTLTELWTAEDTCRVGFNIRIAHSAGWIVIERHGGGLYQAKSPFSTYKQALEETQGKTLREDKGGSSLT